MGVGDKEAEMQVTCPQCRALEKWTYDPPFLRRTKCSHCGCDLEEIQEITFFEIGMLGRHRQDINDHQETYVLRSLPGRIFSVLQLVCIMYFHPS